jgi:hypothetical protein
MYSVFRAYSGGNSELSEQIKEKLSAIFVILCVRFLGIPVIKLKNFRTPNLPEDRLRRYVGPVPCSVDVITSSGGQAGGV